MFASFYKSALLIFLVAIAWRCPAQSKIDTTETLMIGGIKQVIQLSGMDRSKPLFLFITGGPGLPGIYPEDTSFTNDLQKTLHSSAMGPAQYRRDIKA